MQVAMGRRGDYSVRAVLDLARHYEGGRRKARQIAVHQDIPRQYLPQILAPLVRAGLIDAVAGPDGLAVEIRPEVHEAYNAGVDDAHTRMVWTHPGMSTYYRNPRGRVVTVMPWTLVDYWSLTHDVDVAAYTFR